MHPLRHPESVQLLDAKLYQGLRLLPAPHIDQAYAESASVDLWASGFTPGSTVRFELFDANFHLLDTRYATADNSGTYSNGTADTFLSSGTYRGKVWVVAYGSPHQSNWVSLNITS